MLSLGQSLAIMAVMITSIAMWTSASPFPTDPPTINPSQLSFTSGGPLIVAPVANDPSSQAELPLADPQMPTNDFTAGNLGRSDSNTGNNIIPFYGSSTTFFGFQRSDSDAGSEAGSEAPNHTEQESEDSRPVRPLQDEESFEASVPAVSTSSFPTESSDTISDSHEASNSKSGKRKAPHPSRKGQSENKRTKNGKKNPILPTLLVSWKSLAANIEQSKADFDNALPTIESNHKKIKDLLLETRQLSPMFSAYSNRQKKDAQKLVAQMTQQHDHLKMLEKNQVVTTEDLKKQSAVLKRNICELLAAIDVWRRSILQASKLAMIARFLEAHLLYIEFWSENSNWFSQAFTILKWKLEKAAELLEFEDEDGSNANALVTADADFDVQMGMLPNKQADAEVTATPEANPEETNTAAKSKGARIVRSALYHSLELALGPRVDGTHYTPDHYETHPDLELTVKEGLQELVAKIEYLRSRAEDERGNVKKYPYASNTRSFRVTRNKIIRQMSFGDEKSKHTDRHFSRIATLQKKLRTAQKENKNVAAIKSDLDDAIWELDDALSNTPKKLRGIRKRLHDNNEQVLAGIFHLKVAAFLVFLVPKLEEVQKVFGTMVEPAFSLTRLKTLNDKNVNREHVESPVPASTTDDARTIPVNPDNTESSVSTPSAYTKNVATWYDDFTKEALTVCNAFVPGLYTPHVLGVPASSKQPQPLETKLLRPQQFDIKFFADLPVA